MKTHQISKGLVANRFKLTRFIGKGAFAAVYEARDENGKRFAVKFQLSEEDIFSNTPKKENEMIKAIRSRTDEDIAIPKVEYCGMYNQQEVIVMEMLGETVDELRLKTIGGRFKFRTIYQIGYQILTVLEHVHRAGFLHADISPRNIMVESGQRQNRVYLIDFGSSSTLTFARKAEKLGPGTNLTVLHAHHPIADLELLGYTMIWMAKNYFPWNETWEESLVTKNGVTGPKGKQFRKMICEGIPDMEKFFAFIDNLNSTEYPDYKKLRKLIGTILQQRWGCSPTEPIDWNGPTNKTEGFFEK